MFSMWEKVSGAIMDGPYLWQQAVLRKRKVGGFAGVGVGFHTDASRRCGNRRPPSPGH